MSLIKADPKLKTHFGDESFIENRSNGDRARELLTECRSKVSGCLARERDLTGQPDERQAWQKTFGKDTWSEAKQLAMAIFQGNQAVFRDYVLTSEEVASTAKELGNCEQLKGNRMDLERLNSFGNVFDDDSDDGEGDTPLYTEDKPESDDLERANEALRDDDNFDAIGEDGVLSLSQDEREVIPVTVSHGLQHPRPDVAARHLGPFTGPEAIPIASHTAPSMRPPSLLVVEQMSKGKCGEGIF